MLLVTSAIILVSLVVQLVDGSQRIVYVSEPNSDVDDLSTSGDGDGNLICCVYGNCSCNSLDHALANLASNVLINITTDVMFTTLINASNLENVSIIGHNNPTVNCKRAGGIHFNFCYNCIIQNITWDGCGRKTEPGIKLRDSSNIVIEKCSFQYSKGSAIVLSEVSGHVNISHCNFVHNIHYGGHGAAIHYSLSNVTNDLQIVLVIINCNLINNNAKSLVYIENIMSISHNNITFQNTKFCHNKGVSIYVVNENIDLFEKVLFQNNTAENGAGIYMKDHSTVIFGKNSDAAFMQNSADNNGGAVFLTDHSSIIFDQNSMATFNDNNANSGIIYSEVNCNVTFQAACEVTFSYNSVKHCGSAISSSDNCYITFTGNSKVIFVNNKVGYDIRLLHYYPGELYNGGTIYSRLSDISFEGNSITLFWGNFVYDGFGGAICSVNYSSINFKENSTTDFTNNTARYDGGAIYTRSCSISFQESSTADFTYNTATEYGGAIYTRSSSISFEESSTTNFTNNTARYDGGAIYTRSSSISFEESSTTDFTYNTATDCGGAIYTRSSSISFQENSTTDFTYNSATYYGGAIYTRSSSISFTESSTTDFTNNTATYHGGAIYTRSSSISFEESSTTDFTYNTATDCGGAICTWNSSISFEENSTTDFTYNTAYDGGAIYTSNSPISFKESSTTDFTNNTATKGGAISTLSSISFKDSSTTDFTNNTAINGGAIFTYSSMSFEESSTTDFTNNTATYGGAIYTYSSISFEESSTTDFTYNTATYGGAIYASIYSSISFEDGSTTDFINNIAMDDGGAIHSEHSIISFEDISIAKFYNNVAIRNGGAIHSTDTTISSKSNTHVKFNNNAATRGGAIYFIDNFISFEEFSTTMFSNNIAKDYGGALTAEDKSEIIFNNNCTVTFANNNAPVGETVYCGSNSNVTTKENSTVMFNDVLAKWCTNICLPYTGQGTVTIDSNGIVMCSDQKAFACLSENCNCNDLEHLIDDGLRYNKINVVVNIADKAILSSIVWLLYLTNVSIIGQNNLTVFCMNSHVIDIRNCNNLTIQGITWIGCGFYPYEYATRESRTAIDISDSSVIIQKSAFLYSNGPAIKLKLFEENFVMIDQFNFMNNHYYRGHGAAITVSSGPGTLMINNCNFSYNEDAKSIIYLETSHVAMYYNNTTFYSNQGVSIYLSRKCSLSINGDILFKNNRAENGAGIYISDHSTVIFGENSNVNFINNSVDHNGSAIFMKSHSIVTFEQNSIVAFNDNKGINGTMYSDDNSRITFTATSQVIFKSNSVIQYGAAIYCFDNSHVTFTGSSNVKFINNSVDYNGSAIFMNSHSSVTFEQNSIATFCDNKALSGTIYSKNNSQIIFTATSQVIFNSNSVTEYGAAIYSFNNSHVTFTESSNVTFSNNVVSTKGRSTDIEFGGIIFSSTHSCISFDGDSTMSFSNNSANVGAAVFSVYKSSVRFKDRSKATFNSNVAQYCGILRSALSSNIAFNDNTEVTFNHNILSCTSTSNYESSAAAICTAQRTNVMFSGHSVVTFINNTAEQGATVAFSDSNVTIEQYSTVTFSSNIAEYSNGAAFACFNKSIVTIRGNSNVTFNYNKASQSGGAIYSYDMCKITFKDNCTSSFIKNTARDNGGAILSKQFSEITFEGNSTIIFDSNKADNGGTFYFNNSTITIKDTSMMSFYNNRAIYGGAVSANDHSSIAVTGNSMLSFVNNEASQSGGAGYFSHYCNVIMEQNSMITFDSNKALQGGAATVSTNSTFTLQDNVTINFSNNRAQYGGAILLDGSAIIVNGSDKNSITFTNNFARIVGNSIYQDVADSCNRSCLTDRVVGISTEFIATPPNELKFYDPAICIDDDNDTQCNRYYVQDIMLGSDIVIPVCVFDHYNNSVESTQFLVQNESNSNYSISGPREVLIGCNTFEEISILGDQVLSKSTNLSVNINLYVDHNADWKQISVTLIVELSECHLGFWQYSKSQQCDCYNASDTVFCSGSSSTIKRGYWFGSVTGKPTVTFCPINYCNFTCCETSNGYYHLSPVRNDQCNLHRSGTACGSCKSGYTLSFDSTECLKFESCTAGQTVLVILLTVTYWILIVILVFAIMYYKVGIGYLYCITYYYSIVDILLGQNLQASRGLYLTVSIMSSFSKITPQFLGELCLTTGMSGIDQNFIHYIHPSAVILIIVIISFLARISPRFTAIISRGIIHVICLLLLLSYTSIASTSLLLMRPITFYKIDKVYSYLSPDIEYFHGRHLAYGIVALLCSISIVPGLPLLLTLQPILNHKINFVKIKPLLDQFQGCYKDSHRCFAGYYMICRLVIMTIVIANSSNEFIARYVLIVACGVIALMHCMVKPYNNEIINKIDAVVLHLMIFTAALPLIDDFDSPLVITTAFLLLTLPLIIFIALTLFLHKDDLKKIVTHVTFNSQIPNNSTSDKVISDDIRMKEFDSIVDDKARQNVTVTICNINQLSPDSNSYRDPILKVINDIED